MDWMQFFISLTLKKIESKLEFPKKVYLKQNFTSCFDPRWFAQFILLSLAIWFAFLLLQRLAIVSRNIRVLKQSIARMGW